MPAGFLRSDAILHTTFEVETPREHVRLVVARTEVCTAEATARAPTKSRRDGSDVEVPLVDPRALDAGDDLGNRVPDGPGVLLVQAVPRTYEHALEDSV